MNSGDLLEKIKNKKAKVSVIGLGYVGLPLAVLIASKGFQVMGLVRREETAEKLNIGQHHLLEKKLDGELHRVVQNGMFKAYQTNTQTLQESDIIIICVPTPVDKNKKPNIDDLKTIASMLSSLDLSGKLIINESTVSPFMTREILGNLGKDYFLVCSPERIDPGNKDKTTENIPKVMGGLTNEDVNLGKAFYDLILKEKVVTVESLEAAEMAKMLENTYRAVNIALINEFAKLADLCGIDILDVIKAASTKWSYSPHYPSIGVGGHCIPVDPYYILELADSKKLKMNLVKEALEENEKMPSYVLDLILKHYRKQMKVIVYGITYKKNVSDIRESPVIELCNLLKKHEIIFSIYDPFVPKERIEKLGFESSSLEECDIFVIGTDHAVLEEDYKKAVGPKTIVIDGRNFFDKKVGKIVLGIGRSYK